MTLILDEHPNQIAERLTGRDYLSYSAISTFCSCPLRYYFRYIEQLPEKTVSSSLVFGAAIHRAAEFHFREILAGNPPPDLDTLLAEYQDEWCARDPATVRFNKDDENALGQLAERVLLTFQSSDLADPSGKIVGVEEELRGVITQDCPELLARVDLILDQGDSLTVVDLKTSRSRWSESQVSNSADQLMMYAELAKELMPGKRLKLQFAVLSKTKSPSMDMHTITLDERSVARTRYVVQQVWKAIQAGNFYPNPSPMNCGGCSFREPCRAWCG